MPGSDAQEAHKTGQSANPAGGGPIDDATLRAALCDCADGVRQYLFGMCGDADLAGDLSQEAILRAWRGRSGFSGRSAAKTWLFSIARNVWLDYLRRKKTVGVVEGMEQLNQLPSRTPSPLADAWRGELATCLEHALAKLPPDQREALALRQSKGLKFHEVADLLGVQVATVKSRVRYALLKLADELESYRDDI